jgi:hypothetical protein
MKNTRLFTLLMIVILAVSAWTPAAVSARGLEQPTLAPSLSLDPVTTQVVRLSIHNRTGGTLFVTLEGPKSYYFTIGDSWARFDIVPGRYRVTAISTACSTKHEQSKNMKKGGNLAYVCDSQ